MLRLQLGCCGAVAAAVLRLLRWLLLLRSLPRYRNWGVCGGVAVWLLVTRPLAMVAATVARRAAQGDHSPGEAAVR